MKRVLALFLCVVMLIGFAPIQMRAAATSTDGLPLETSSPDVSAEETLDPNAGSVDTLAVSDDDVVIVDHDSTVTGYKTLQDAFDGIAGNAYGGTYVITLQGDTAGAVSINLQFPSEVLNITLDLNGHTLTGTSSAAVVSINFGSNASAGSTFTITDSVGGGTITGGKQGVFFTGKACTMYFNAGTITGNHGATTGGGICLGNTAHLVMNGGTITGNSVTGTSGDNVGLGGGIFGNDVTINGGAIYGNYAYGGSGKYTGRGGGISTDIKRSSGYSTLTIASGTVFGNYADNAGDDVMAQGNGLNSTKHTLVIGTENWYIDGWNGTKHSASQADRYSAENPVPYTDGGWNNVNNKAVGLKYVAPAVPTCTVTYTDGVEGEEGFADQTYTVDEGSDTPAFEGTPAREGYTFAGWVPEVAETVTADVTYTAKWDLVTGGDIYRAYLDNGSGRIYLDLMSVAYNESVALQLYSGETLLTTATLNAVEYPAPLSSTS